MSGHLFEQIFVNQGLGPLKIELVGATLTDFFSCVLKSVEKSLQDARHFHNVQVLDVQERLLPVLRNQRRVLFFVFISDLRRVRGAGAVSASVCSDTFAFHVLLMLNSSLRIVEHLGQEVPLGLLDSLRLLELIHRFLAFLVSSCFLSTFLSLSGIKSIVYLPIDLLTLHVLQLAINISAQVLVLDTLPLATVLLASVKSTADLLFSELTVLSHRVEAHDVLNFLGREGLWFDIWPVSFVSHVLCIRVIGFEL